MYYTYLQLLAHMIQFDNVYYVPDYQMWCDAFGSRIRSITDTRDGRVRVSYHTVDDTIDTLDSEIFVTVYELKEINLD